MQFVLILHSLVRWFILLFGLWTIINALTGVFSKRPFTAGDNRSNLFFMISCDIQLLIGLILYFGGVWFSLLKNNADMVMHNSSTRFFAVEHETAMILAWLLVHIGRSSVKKATSDASKHSRMLVFFGLAFILILISIPWPFRQEIARPWFRL
jgi:hypothetical protein